MLALMGDLIDHGGAPTAVDDLAEVHRVILAAAAEAVLVAVPGNHDHREQYLQRFGQPTVRQFGGYRFITFADEYAEGDFCTRSEADRRRLDDLAAQGGGPIIALQHNPMNPAIDDPYPYMLTNRDQVMADYAREGVLLSISGHYHAGQPLSRVNGVGYVTAPALTESPFGYTMIQIEGSRVTAEFRGLRVADVPIIDCHAHTEYAYCGRGMSAELTVSRAREFGLAGICLTEHAPQLYMTADDFWEGKHVRSARIWRKAGGRMEEFRQRILPLRDGFVRVGLEVELDADGVLTIRDEDRDWPEVLVGAIHFLKEDLHKLDDAQLASVFMRDCRRLCRAGIDVLAHPWRLFQRANRPTPTHLYGELAALLAETRVAAEINYHTNFNDPAFIAECIRLGVKIATGSDGHAPWEAGGFTAHVETLRHAAGRQDIADLLWRPRR